MGREFFFFKTGGKLLYNVVLVSAIQPLESVIIIYIYMYIIHTHIDDMYIYLYAYIQLYMHIYIYISAYI